MSARSRVGIVAALAGEVKPFIAAARLKRIARGRLNVFESEGYVVAYAGIGAERAREACAAVWQRGGIGELISVGWCGAMHAGIPEGTVQLVREVIDERTGERFPAGGGTAALVTVSRVAATAEKRALRERTGADLVDMEAAHVARFAQQHGVVFHAVKAVSDAHDAVLPEMQAFTSGDGQFQTAKFTAWLMLRPQWWGRMARMGMHAAASAKRLSATLQAVGGSREQAPGALKEA